MINESYDDPQLTFGCENLGLNLLLFLQSIDAWFWFTDLCLKRYQIVYQIFSHWGKLDANSKNLMLINVLLHWFLDCLWLTVVSSSVWINRVLMITETACNWGLFLHGLIFFIFATCAWSLFSTHSWSQDTLFCDVTVCIVSSGLATIINVVWLKLIDIIVIFIVWALIRLNGILLHFN